MKNKKNNRFWMIYGIAMAVSCLAIAIFLIFFNSYISEYENSQHSTVLDEYVSSLDASAVREMVVSAIDELDMKYEYENTYVDLLCGAVDISKLSYRKLYAEYTDEVPVYSLLSESTELAKLTLKKSDKGGNYGFAEWEIGSCVISLDGITKNAKSYTLYVPSGAEFTVNGFAPDKSEADITYPITSKLEETSLPKCDKIELGTLYSAPDVKCTLDGSDCVKYEENGEYFYFPAGVHAQSYTISAPIGAEVSVNGITLDKEYVTEEGILADCSLIEKDKPYVPKTTVYKTGVLFSAPVLAATLDGVKLDAEVADTDCKFLYPDAYLYDVSITVPAGAVVTINGISVSEVAEKQSENVFGGLSVGGVTLPTLDRYDIKGLYSAEHEVTATLDGAALSVTAKAGKNSTVYSSDLSTVVDAGVADFVTRFVKTYFTYTSQGYNNIDANLAATLSYITQGSELYSRVQNSRIGYWYNTPVSSEVYNKAEISEVYPVSENGYCVRYDFDIDQTVIYVKREFKGSLYLYIEETAGAMKVRDMIIEVD